MTAVRQEGDAPRGFVTMREYLRLRDRCEELEAIVASHQVDDAEDVDENIISKLRLEAGLSPQGAIVVSAIARSRRVVLLKEALMEATDAASESSLACVCHFANKAAAARGAPVLIRGVRNRAGGRYLTSEGRAWLQERVPELFSKGGPKP